MERGAAMAEARWWQAVLPSPPACTAGGPAIYPASRPELQHPIHDWSLPQHVLCMPMCSRRLHSASRVDDLQHRIRRRLHFCSTAAYRLEALDKLNVVDRTRAREKRVITRASREAVFASGGGLVPSVVSKCTCRAAGTRAFAGK